VSASVTVVTASLPERAAMLAEAVASVAAQTVAVQSHLVGIDHARRGGAAMKNALASAVTTEWTMVLDDDDLLLPDHVATLIANAGGADVVYSAPVVEGDPLFTLYDEPFSHEMLRRASIVSHTALVRTELLLDLGGWPIVQGYDWMLWRAAADAGAKFKKVDGVTWVYRLTPEWAHESRP
jgi:hypothetical protein